MIKNFLNEDCSPSNKICKSILRCTKSNEKMKLNSNSYFDKVSQNTLGIKVVIMKIFIKEI